MQEEVKKLEIQGPIRELSLVNHRLIPLSLTRLTYSLSVLLTTRCKRCETSMNEEIITVTRGSGINHQSRVLCLDEEPLCCYLIDLFLPCIIYLFSGIIILKKVAFWYLFLSSLESLLPEDNVSPTDFLSLPLVAPLRRCITFLSFMYLIILSLMDISLIFFHIWNLW